MMGRIVLSNILSLGVMVALGLLCAHSRVWLHTSLMTGNVLFGILTVLMWYFFSARNSLTASFSVPLVATIMASATVFEEDDTIFWPIALAVASISTVLVGLASIQEKKICLYAVGMFFIQLIASTYIIPQRDAAVISYIGALSGLLIIGLWGCSKLLQDSVHIRLKAKA